MSRKKQIKAKVVEGLNTSIDFDVFRVAKDLYEDLDTPVSLGCWMRCHYNEWEQLARMSVKPADYCDVPRTLKMRGLTACAKLRVPSRQAFFDDRSAVDFLRKYEGLSTGIDKRAVALATFRECEKKCRRTNTYFASRRARMLSFPRLTEEVLFDARRIISDVLGDFNVEEWLSSCSVGPGVNSGYRFTSDIDKLSRGPLGVTEEFEPFSLAFCEEFQGWFNARTSDGQKPDEVLHVWTSSTYASVPKDALTDRSIETQPLLNAFAQRGIGIMMARRLKLHCGIDLSDQSANQLLASTASITGRDATVDLRNASALICLELIRELYPSDWFHAMNITRCHWIKLPDGAQDEKLQQMSGMGNGYTFEMQTLLFYALSMAVAEKFIRRPKVRVYGDDIILPSSCYDTLCAVFATLGFEVNLKKSYATGKFRESCGTDWWDGFNVRPYFLKERISDVSAIVSLANGLRRLANRHSGANFCDVRFARSYFRCVRGIPPHLRKWIAVGFTESDDFICGDIYRQGFTIRFVTKRIPVTMLAHARTAMLYRMYARSRDESCETPYVESPLFPGGEGGSASMVANYQRKLGHWGAKHVPYWQIKPYGAGAGPMYWARASTRKCREA